MAQRLAANIPAQPFGQQQELGQAELRPGGVRFGVEAAGDNLDDVAGAGDERFYFGKRKRRGGVRDCEHLGPSFLFDGIPVSRRLGQIAQGEPRLLVGATADKS